VSPLIDLPNAAVFRNPAWSYRRRGEVASFTSSKDLCLGFLAVVSYHRIKALPHVIPAPIAIIAIRSPG
jgi:hypothetical protein